MENEHVFENIIIEKLVNLNSDLTGKGSCVAWTTFPFSLENLDLVERSIKKLNWDEREYSINYDENLIFVEKDLL